MPIPRATAVARLIAVAVPSLGIATVLVAVLKDSLGVPNPSAVYLIAVVATALVSGTAGGIVASVAAFLLYNFLFTEPRFQLTIDEPGDWLGVLLLLFVGVVVGQLAALQRSRADDARAREVEALGLFRVSRALAARESTPAALSEVVAILVDGTSMSRAWVALGPDDAAERIAADSGTGVRPSLPGVQHVLRRTPGDQPAHWVRIHQPPRAGQGSAAPTAPTADPGAAARQAAYRIRIEAGGAVLGSVWSLRERGRGEPDRTETRLLSAAADQIGQALGHDRLAAERQAAEIARQSDAVKSALLQSVSHDLRTPLATIRAAAGSLRPGSGLSPDEQLESAEAIDREVEYLNRLVTNLLDLSRIEAGALRAEREVFELDDLVGRSLDRLRGRLAGRDVEVSLAGHTVDADPVFLDDALTNVLENAIKHTPAGTGLRITAQAAGDHVRLTIEDAGPGVPEAALPALFDKFYRVPGSRRDSRAGTGIGLAVVRGLIEASRGSATARRSELGGLAIDLMLPAASVPADLGAAS